MKQVGASMDMHYTPIEYATEILSQMTCRAPTTVADFAAGEGALLFAARKRWPDCNLVAVDVDPSSVRKLRRKFRNISVTQKDFLDVETRALRRPLSAMRKRVSLVFLNPPFSCRGGSLFTASLNGRGVRCSKALAFVINSLPYITRAGRIVAILPSSCLTSQKDAQALAELRLTHSIEVVASVARVKFEGCSVEVTTICIQRLKGRSATALAPAMEAPEPTRHYAAIARGNVPMAPQPPELQIGGFRLVHTTNLRRGAVANTETKRVDGIAVSGPLLLLPRVGKPNLDKVCLYTSPEPIVLSDCVIALRCADSVMLRAIHARILANGDAFLRTYVGSCAKYLTFDRLGAYLASIGVRGEKMSIVDFQLHSHAQDEQVVMTA